MSDTPMPPSPRDNHDKAYADPQGILKGLNPAQREAVLHTDGPAMIIAGAGSGKTRVLTHRLAWLIHRGKADSFELMALTFTNKAAREMRDRIERLVGREARNIAMGTFHSIFARILRQHAEALGYTSNYTIYDTDDSVSLIKAIVKELRYDDKKYKPRNLLSRISNAKNHLVGPPEYREQYVSDDFSEKAAEVYERYQKRLFEANAMDFDDLLVNMVKLFRKAPNVLHQLQHRYKYLMVDEYQDTNYAQYIITKKLAAVHENLCVVGDDAQSIYSFRGASIENILNFQKDYPDVQIFKLEQNYRSTGTIVSAANEVIANNKQQLEKRVFTENEVGTKIRTIVGANEQDEAARIVDAVREQKMRAGLLNQDFALLYRTNAQSRALEDGLRRAGLPYKIYGGLSFYRRKEVKDVAAYLRLAINPADEEALKRVINYPARGIGQTTLQRIAIGADEHGISFWEALQRAREMNVGARATAIEGFVTTVKAFGSYSRKLNAADAVEKIAKESGILKELHRENSTESLSRWENVQEVINAAREFTDDPQRPDEQKLLSDYLAEIALYTDQDQNADNPDHITLMTIHAAKGLEFKSVFVTGLEENLFPSMMATQSRADLEEERRLFYVAITRAERHLTLSYAKQRFKYGHLEFQEPSRFLEEIDEKYLEMSPLDLRRVEVERMGQILPRSHKPAYLRKEEGPQGREATSRAAQARLNMADGKREPFVGDDLKDLRAGQVVEHAKFGRGVVQSVEGSGEKQRAVVDFKVKGQKTLLLKYAKLKIVG